MDTDVNEPSPDNHALTTTIIKDDVNALQTSTSLVDSARKFDDKTVNSKESGVFISTQQKDSLAGQASTSVSGNNNNEKDFKDSKKSNWSQRATVICRPVEPIILKGSHLDVQNSQMFYQKQQNNQQWKEQHLNTTSAKIVSIGTTTIKTEATSEAIPSMVTPKCSAQSPQKFVMPPLNIQNMMPVPKITITSPPGDKPNTIVVSGNQQLEDVKRRLYRQILLRRQSCTTSDANSKTTNYNLPKATLLLPPQSTSRPVNSNSNSICSSTVAITAGTITGSTSTATSTISVRKFSSLASSTLMSTASVPDSAINSATPVSHQQHPQQRILLTTTPQPVLLSTSTNKLTTKQHLINALGTQSQGVKLVTATTQLKLPVKNIPNQPTRIKLKEENPNFRQFVTIKPIVIAKKATVTSFATATKTPAAISKESLQNQINPLKITDDNSQVAPLSTFLPKSTIIRVVNTTPITSSNATPIENISGKLLESPKLQQVKSSHELAKKPKIQQILAISTVNDKTLTGKIKTNSFHVGQTTADESKVTNIPIVLENKLLNANEKIDLKNLRLAPPSVKNKMETPFTQTLSVGASTTKKLHRIISADKLKFSSAADMAALAKKIVQRVGKPATTTEPKTIQPPSPKKASENKAEASEQLEALPAINYEVTAGIPFKPRPTILKASLTTINRATITNKISESRKKNALRKKVLAFCGIKDGDLVSPVKEYPNTVEIVDEDTVDIVEGNATTTAVDFIASLGATIISKATPNNDVVSQRDCDDKNKQKESSTEARLEKVSSEGEVEGDLKNSKLQKSTENNKIKADHETNLTTTSQNILQKNIKENDDDNPKCSNTSEPLATLTVDIVENNNPQSSTSFEYCKISLEPKWFEKANLEENKNVPTTKIDSISSHVSSSPSPEKETNVGKEMKMKNSVKIILKDDNKETVPPKEHTSFNNVEENLDKVNKPTVTTSERLEDSIEISKNRTESSVAEAVPKTTRKRIGIRNAPINLVPRKKPLIKKPQSKSDNVVKAIENIAKTTTEKEISFEPEKTSTATVVIESFIQTQEELSSGVCKVSPNKNLKSNAPMSNDFDLAKSEKSEVNIDGTSFPVTSEQNSIETNIFECSNSNTTFEEKENIVKQQDAISIVPDYIKQIETGSNDVDIKILASVSGNQSPIFFGELLEAKDDNGDRDGGGIGDHGSEAQNIIISESKKAAPVIPEVGTIINMDEYCLEKSNAQIILQGMDLENLDSTKNLEETVEELKPQKGSNIGKQNFVDDIENLVTAQDVVEVKEGNDENMTDEIRHDDTNDNSDNSSHSSNSFSGRKRLRRKRRRCCSLSTSESELDVQNVCVARAGRTLTSNPDVDGNPSIGSNSTELFGFIEQPGTVNSFREFTTLHRNTKTEKTPADFEMPSSPLPTDVDVDTFSPQSSDKKFDFMLPVPVTTVDNRRHVPPKKRWELSQQHSQDETDITDDTSPAADDDDTMDAENITPECLTLSLRKEKTKNKNELQKNCATIPSLLLKETIEESSNEKNPAETINESLLAVVNKGKSIGSTKTTECIHTSSPISTKSPLNTQETLVDSANKLQSFTGTISCSQDLESCKNNNSLSMEEAEKDKATAESESGLSQKTVSENPKESTFIAGIEDTINEPRKRGRKSKKILSESTSDSCPDSEVKRPKIDDELQSQTITSTPKRKKRGRPPKNTPRIDSSAESGEVYAPFMDDSKGNIKADPAALQVRFEDQSEQSELLSCNAVESTTSAPSLPMQMKMSETVAVAPEVIAKKKRGRPRMNLKVEMPDKSEDLKDVSQVPDAPLPYSGKKRGRKPRNKSAAEQIEQKDFTLFKCHRGRMSQSSLAESISNLDSSVDDLTQTVFDQSVTDFKDTSLPSPDVTVDTTTDQVIPLTKKRGRKPRISTPDVLNESQPVNSYTDVSSEAPLPEKKKRGRKPKSLSNPDNVTLDTTENSSTPIQLPKNKPGRKPQSSLNDETSQDIIEQPQNDNEDAFVTPLRKRRCRVVGDFNARLLLIRNREQLDTNEILTVPKSENTDADLLQCGLCLGRTNRTNWLNHISEHYGVGWIVGKEPEVDVTTRSIVLSCMLAFFKRPEVTTLSCRLCSRTYRSPLGMLMHLETCGDAHIRVICPTCNNEYSKFTFLSHQRICQFSKKKENSAVEDSSDSSLAIENSNGRRKRASLIKAKSKLKKLTRDLVETEVVEFQPKSFIKHQTDANMGKVGFYCTVCSSGTVYFQTEADAVRHVEKQHQSRRRSKKNIDSGGSDFDGNSEWDSACESDNTELSSDDNDVENEKPNRKKRPRAKQPKISVRSIKRLEPVYPNRSTDLPKVVLKRWKQFLSTNYADETLYPYALPTYVADIKETVAALLPAPIESMKFSNSSALTLSKVVGSFKRDEEWRTLERFETSDHNSNEKLIYIGGPIKEIAWAPVPDAITEQYLLVAFRRDLSTFTRFHNPKVEEGLLLLYKVTKEKHDSQDTSKRLYADLHYALLIPSGPVHTFAFLPSGGYDTAKNRLGLLAVGTACSDIKIYALPIEPENCHKVDIESKKSNPIKQLRVLELLPAMELTLSGDIDDSKAYSKHTLVATHCLRICWSEFADHQHIFASFSNGYIGIWNIKEAEPSENVAIFNLNSLIRNGRRCFLPLNYFYFAEKSVNGLAVHYDTSGPRWLVAHGFARKMIVYDIRNLTQPIPLKDEMLKNVPRSVDWSPVWEPLALAICDGIPYNGHSIQTFNPVGVNYVVSRMEYAISGVSTLHYNPWLHVYTCGTDNGDLVYMNTRELNHELHWKSGTKRKPCALSTMDIKRLDGQPLPYPTSDRMPENWQVFDKDYKDKYGLVFGSIFKLDSENRSTFLDPKRTPPRNVERYMRINVMRWNLNRSGKRFAAAGYENGFLRLTNFQIENFFKENKKKIKAAG